MIVSEHSIEVKGSLQELQSIRGFIIDSALHLGISKALAANLALAVDEACSNIIVHGVKKDNDMLEISMFQQENSLSIHIKDFGVPFDPNCVGQQNMQEYFRALKNGGLGIEIIRKVIDSIEYIPRCKPEESNTLILNKALSL